MRFGTTPYLQYVRDRRYSLGFVSIQTAYTQDNSRLPMSLCTYSDITWGGAMVLGKVPVPGRPTILIRVGQGPTALAVGAGGVVWTFFSHLSLLSSLSLSLLSQRAVKPKTTNQRTLLWVSDTLSVNQNWPFDRGIA